LLKELAYINGDFMDLQKARIDALDRGFIFGDGLYEVVAVFEGKFYQMDEHLQRYQDGAREMLMENAPSPQELKEATRELKDKAELEKGIIYFQVTRGTAPRTHHFPSSSEPNVFMFVKEPPFPDAEKRKKGIKTIVVPDERWNRCHIKSINLLPNCFYKEKARQEGAFEAIQEHSVGITEGTSTNLFAVKDEVLLTAPSGNRILNGITRKTVLNLAEELGIQYEEKFMSKKELYCCDEVFLTSTINQVLPINQVDEITYPVDSFEITFKLQKALERHIDNNLKE